MSFDGVDNRKYPRVPFSDHVDYWIASSGMDKTLRGLSVTIAEGGLSFYTSHPIEVGQDIVIKTSLDAPHVKATVRWVKKYLDDLYRVGVMFTG